MSGINTSTISKVYYEELGNIDSSEMSEFYFYYNHFQLSDDIARDYEEYETRQIKIRNKIIANAIKQNQIPGRPNISSTLFGVSSIKNKPIIIVEC